FWYLSSTPNYTIKEAEINYLAIVPLFDLFSEPELLNENYWFLKDRASYLEGYKKFFINAKKKTKLTRNLRSPYIKNFGRFNTVSGSDLKFNPIYRDFHGDINFIT